MIPPPSDTLWALVEARAADSPDAPFLIDERDVSLTFDGYRAAVERTAAGLARLGVTARDTVAWQLPTWIESLILIGALARLGARQMPLLPMYRAAELAPLLRRAGATFWCLPSRWRGTDFAAIAAEVRAGLPALRPITCDRTLPVGNPDELPPAPKDSDTADRWIFPSSGTTSEPKGVLHTDRSILAGSAGFVTALGVRADDRVGIAFPLTHIGGANNLAAALQVGCSLVINEAFQPAETAACFRRHGVTIIAGGPAFYAGLLEVQRRQPGEPILPHLRFMTGGGAPMPPEMHFDVRREIGGRGCAHGYGMTEACVVAMNHPDDDDDKLSQTVGRPTKSVEVRIVDPSGAEVPAGAEGEIRIRGAAVCTGYLDPSAQAAGWDSEGWFKTGDLGRVDDAGYLSITGRAKDIIIRKGENISATELEAVLYTHPRIAAVAVIGLPDPVRGERVCAVVQPADGQPLTLDDIVAHCQNAGLMRQKFPEQLELVDQLPYTQTGKVVKTELRARFGGQPA